MIIIYSDSSIVGLGHEYFGVKLPLHPPALARKKRLMDKGLSRYTLKATVALSATKNALAESRFIHVKDTATLAV